MAGVIGNILHGVYGVVQDNVSITPSVSLIALTMAIGVVTSMIAAGIPARNAARVDPIQALYKGKIHMLHAAESRVRTVGSFCFVTIGAILCAKSQSLGWFYAGYGLVILAAVLMTPVLSRSLAKALRLVLGWLRPVEGALAADSLIGSAHRTAATVGALMLSLALVIGLAGTARATYSNIMQWVSSALNSDFFVSSSPTLTGNNYRFPESMAAQLVSIDGIEALYSVRTARIEYRNDRILLVVSDIAELAKRSPPQPIAGSRPEMYRLAAAGEGVIGSESFASLRRLHIGDQIELSTPVGILKLPLVGLVREYSDQEGEVFLDRAVYKKYWNDDTVDHFRVFLKPGANPDHTRAAILKTFSSSRQIFVLSNQEVRTYIGGLANQWFGITWVQISIAILVAILGIINSLTVTISDRRRELGVLRAVGALPGQVRITIWMEAAGIACIGLTLGLILGAIHLYYVLEMTYRDYPGLRFDYVYPGGIAALLLPIILTASLLSAVGPAEAAVRGSLVEALEYE